MKVIVAAKQLQVTEAMRQFIEQQVEKFAKLHKKITQVRVYLEQVSRKSKDAFTNKVTFEIHIPGKNVVVKKHAIDMYKAVVEASEASLRQLRKEYERRMTLRRQRLAT